MSYCRWSSDNWKCDLYCYADCQGGYTTHVAARKIGGDPPEAPIELLVKGRADEWLEAYRRQQRFRETCPSRNIGLPYDGESFNDRTLDQFLARLLHLREVGYHFPDYVLERVRGEIVEHIRKMKKVRQ